MAEVTLSPVPKWSVNEKESGVFSIAISADNSFVGSCMANGEVLLRSSTTGRLSYTLTQSPGGFPATSIRFIPSAPKYFLAASSDGIVNQWTIANPKITWSGKEGDNQIFAMDVSPNGSLFATAGLDRRIRVYDFETKTINSILYRSEIDYENSFGHTNRIFSLIFSPSDPNIVFSGGWDDTIQVWDLRMKSSIRSMYGPHITSDSMDIHGDTLLTGSFRTKSQIQMWDLRTFTESMSVSWSPKGDEKQCLLFAAKFHPSGDFFIAGGSGSNQVRFFSSKTCMRVGKSTKLPSACYSVKFTQDGQNVIIGTGSGDMSYYGVVPSPRN